MMIDFTGLQIRAKSPDGSVVASMTDDFMTEVSITPHGGLAGYSDQSLADQVNAAVAGVYRGLDRGLNKKIDESRDGAAADESPMDPGLHASVAAIDVEERSPRGFVKCQRRGHGDPEVRFKPGSLRQAGFDPVVLAAEINRALEAVKKTYSKQVMDACFNTSA